MIKAHRSDIQDSYSSCSVFKESAKHNFAVYSYSKYRIWPNGKDDDGITVYHDHDLKSWGEFKLRIKEYFGFDLLDEFKPCFVE